MLKKITKCLLALTLLLTGVILTPTRINAVENEARGSVANVWNETDVILADLGSAGIINIYPTYRFTQYQGDTEMTIIGNTVVRYVTDTIINGYEEEPEVSGICSLNTNSYLSVVYTIYTTYNNKSYKTQYKIMYLHNQIYRKFVLNQERL